MDIGEKMKRRRLELHYSLEKVGNYVGVGKSTVRKWENGAIRNMGRDKIALVAQALKVTPEYLMGWEDANGESIQESNLAQTTEGRIISEGVDSMPEEARQRAVALLCNAFPDNKYFKEAYFK